MDPQQRLLLEVSGRRWSGPGSTRVAARHGTGVFVGAARPATLRSEAGGYRLTGSRERDLRAGWPTRSGLEGPAVTVDTACSSSLVALHLAAQALRVGRVHAGAGRRRAR